MFYGCSALSSLNVSSFNTGNVTDMREMFSGCKALQTLDLSGFDTANVTNMRSMFLGCENMTRLDVTSFDTSKVTGSYCMYGMFNKCKLLSELDLSSFNTAIATDMGYMFYECNSLSAIYVSPLFVVTQVTSSLAMFTSCSSLVGGAGTAYQSSNPKDKTYARIDNPPDAPGYFTLKTA